MQLTERLTIMKLVKLFPKTDEALIGDEVHILINLNLLIQIGGFIPWGFGVLGFCGC